MKELFKQLVIIGDALSQLGNTMIGGKNANESISGRSYREGWKLETWIDRLFFWQVRHCKASYENDVHRAVELLTENDRRESGFFTPEIRG